MSHQKFVHLLVFLVVGDMNCPLSKQVSSLICTSECIVRTLALVLTNTCLLNTMPSFLEGPMYIRS